MSSRWVGNFHVGEIAHPTSNEVEERSWRGGAVLRHPADLAITCDARLTEGRRHVIVNDSQ